MKHRLRVERLEARDMPASSFRSLPVLPFHDLVALDHMRAIAAQGRELGRRQDVVLKIGDSNSSPFPKAEYLAALGSPSYDPMTSGLAATYPELLDTWWEFRRAPNSLVREGRSARPGLRAAQVLEVLPREIATVNPGIAIIKIGTNDALVTRNATSFRSSLGKIDETLLSARIVPVLSTIPDSAFRGGSFEPALMVFNQVIAGVAKRYAVPLWNCWASLHELPFQGLGPDGVHLNASPNGAGSFWPPDLNYAQNARNLQVLRILDWFRERICKLAPIGGQARAWQPMESGRPLYAVSRDGGSPPRVDVYDADTAALVNRFLAFRFPDALGVRVLTGDTNSDGFIDIVCTAPGTGIVRVVSGADGSTLAQFRPFGVHPVGAISVALGELDGVDGLEIVAARGCLLARVHVYAGNTFERLSTFDPRARSALRIAVVQVEGLGPVIAALEDRGRAILRYFSIAGGFLEAFALDEPPGRGRTIVAADLDRDGSDEIVLGRVGDHRQVTVLDGVSHARLADRTLGPAVDRSLGIRIGVVKSSEGHDLILIASAPGEAVAIRKYDDLSDEPTVLPLANARRAYGIFVG